MNKVEIKDIVDIYNGSTPSTSVLDNFDGNISWITPKDISDQKTKYISNGQRNITEKGLNSIGGNLLPKGTILFSSRAPIGLMSICTNETSTNQGFKNMVCKKDKIDNEYLYYLLKTQISKIQELGTGTTFKEVSKTTSASSNSSIWAKLQALKICKEESFGNLFIELSNNSRASSKRSIQIKQSALLRYKEELSGNLFKEVSKTSSASSNLSIVIKFRHLY